MSSYSCWLHHSYWFLWFQWNCWRQRWWIRAHMQQSLARFIFWSSFLWLVRVILWSPLIRPFLTLLPRWLTQPTANFSSEINPSIENALNNSIFPGYDTTGTVWSITSAGCDQVKYTAVLPTIKLIFNGLSECRAVQNSPIFPIFCSLVLIATLGVVLYASCCRKWAQLGRNSLCDWTSTPKHPGFHSRLLQNHVHVSI